jgi:hypothetical protein
LTGPRATHYEAGLVRSGLALVVAALVALVAALPGALGLVGAEGTDACLWGGDLGASDDLGLALGESAELDEVEDADDSLDDEGTLRSDPVRSVRGPRPSIPVVTAEHARGAPDPLRSMRPPRA